MKAPEASRYKMTIAYDGTAYAGWQIQPKALTIQEMIERALETICGERPRVHGSGRTDQGVHALGQVAHFDLSENRPVASLQKGLNGILPADIRVMGLSYARADFHARRCARSKVYRYFIWNHEVLPPHLRLYRAHIKRQLDVSAMRIAANTLVGRNDFAAFSANPNREVESTVRDVTGLRLSRRGHEITLTAEGEGFLYKMVRSLAGFLIRVGEGGVSQSEAAPYSGLTQAYGTRPDGPRSWAFSLAGQILICHTPPAWIT